MYLFSNITFLDDTYRALIQKIALYLTNISLESFSLSHSKKASFWSSWSTLPISEHLDKPLVCNSLSNFNKIKWNTFCTIDQLWLTMCAPLKILVSLISHTACLSLLHDLPYWITLGLSTYLMNQMAIVVTSWSMPNLQLLIPICN